MSLADIRDWAVIILAALAIVQTIFFTLLIVVLIIFALGVRGRILPILDSIKGTVGSIQGSSSFLSGSVVKPFVTLFSIASGVVKAIQMMARPFRRKGEKGR